MQQKGSAIVGTLLAAGAILVIAGIAIFSVQSASNPKLTFSNHSKSRVLGSSSSTGPKASGHGANNAPMVSPPPSAITPSLSPASATYPVTGTVVLAPQNNPLAGHEIEITGSTPMKTFTDAQGHFAVHLPVGHYSLMLNPQVGPGNQSWTFTVTRQPLTLNFTAKSGR